MSVKFITRASRRALAAAALAGASALAQANGFSCISGSFSDCSLASSTLSWTWNGLDFTISNTGAGYVSEVYFDLSGGMSASFQGGTGGSVLFYSGANPSSLPGGASVGFTSDSSYDSDPAGTTHNGIDAGETATFRILGGSLSSFDSNTLAAGVHVRSLIDNSASLVTTNLVTPVPEPETYAMMGLGFLGLLWATRRRKA